ncbi:MAG: polyprenyl synthetase family protein [Lysobacterales bacterium]
MPLIPTRPELSPALQSLATRVEAVMDWMLPPADIAPQSLHEAMRYSVLGGGKRLRPLLVYAAATSVGGLPEHADAAAGAVELIHAYSLIHDDLPAMDDDELRRGQPTCHVAFGEATAILAGDALQALAFEVLAGDDQNVASPGTRVEMLRLLAAACGADGMAGGQALDLQAVGTSMSHAELEYMHTQKTGALIRASVQLGALCAGCCDRIVLDQLKRAAGQIGLAFQIKDDILDIEGDTAVIGKRQGADIARNKPTYPATLGMAASRELAERLRQQALAELAPLGAAAELLRDLACYAVDRRS